MEFGRNFSDIPIIAVEFYIDDLDDRDMITDDRGHILIYRKKELCIKLFTNDQDDYVTDIDLFDNSWRKV